MKWKAGLMHGLLSTAVASITAIVYNALYTKAFLIDFSAVLNVGGIVISSTIGCMLMAVGCIVCTGRWGSRWSGILNVGYVVLSFLSILGLFTFHLPLEIESPELFPGLAIPMHFFPALSFMAFAPFFSYWQRDNHA